METMNAQRSKLPVLGIDADDTLWHTERVFDNYYNELASLLEPWLKDHDQDTRRKIANDRLIQTERKNLAVFGYGTKGFVLSLVETALELSNFELDGRQVATIIQWGREMIEHPVEPIDGVTETLAELSTTHRLIMITKGDLFDQETKIARSNLEHYFDGIEILKEKTPEAYRAVLHRLATSPESFTMVGNSAKSDVLPVLEIGASAIHIPYELTWELEVATLPKDHAKLATLSSFKDLPAHLGIRP